ncbi:unnamed protein product [Arctogadus glacialis]
MCLTITATTKQQQHGANVYSRDELLQHRDRPVVCPKGIPRELKLRRRGTRAGAMTVGDCIQEEGLFYVAGWLVRVLQKEEIVQACPHCEVLLLGARHQDHSYATSEDQPFLEAKKYTATANLMRPSEGFFAAIQLLEGEFAGNANSDAFWPLTQITKKMERALGSLGVFNSLFSSHPEHASL